MWKEKRTAVKQLRKVRQTPLSSREEVEKAENVKKAKVEAFKHCAAEAKTAKWEHYMNEIGGDKTLGKFWKLHRQMQRKERPTTVGTIYRDDGVRATTDKEKGEAFLERFIAQTDHNDVDIREAVREDLSGSVRNAQYEDIIRVDDIKHILKMAKDTAPGPDGVRYGHMKELSNVDLREMTDCFNQSIRTASVPQDWVHSYLVPLPKPLKDHSKLSGYRIITLQNTFGKVLEKAVAVKLRDFLERGKLLPSGLGSYRPGKDTWSNAATFAYDVYEGFQNRQETMVAALDLEDAYNRVRYDILMTALMEKGVSPWLVNWIAAVLYSRRVALRLGSWTSEPRIIAPGLPQGSAISPVLFNVYTSKIASLEAPGVGRILTFADDILAYRQGRDRKQTAQELQATVDKVFDWCTEMSAVVHPDKASVLWCSLDNRIVRADVPGLTIDGRNINRESNLKYLGITFDRSLSFKDHVQTVVIRSQKGLNALKTMAAKDIEQRMLFTLYQHLVLSVIDYGLGLLTISKSQMTKLERIQNAAMRVILGCTRDTPIVCMRYILGLPTIAGRLKVLQAKSYLRVAADTDHPLYEALDAVKGQRLARGRSWMAQGEDTIKQVCTLENIKRGEEWVKAPAEQSDLCRVIITLSRQCRNWPAGAVEVEIQQLIQDNARPGDVIIYTDGSVSRGRRSAWGFIAKAKGRPLVQQSLAYETTTSSLRMEVEAVTAAFRWLENTTHTHIVIVTDSESMLRKVRTGMLRAEWLASLRKTRVKRIVWIFSPGHAGVVGNEQADRLAGTAQLGGILMHDKADVVKALWDHVCSSEEQMDHHSLVRMMQRGVTRGSGRYSTLRGKARRTYNQTATGTIGVGTLRWLLRMGTEHIWECPECCDVGS